MQRREPIVHEPGERFRDPVGREPEAQHLAEAGLPALLRRIAADERHGVRVLVELTRHVHPRCSSEDPAEPAFVAIAGADLLGVAWTTPRRGAEHVDERPDRRVVVHQTERSHGEVHEAAQSDPIREELGGHRPRSCGVLDEQLGPPVLAPRLRPCGCSVDAQATPLLDERGNVLTRPEPAEAEELLPVQLETPALPRLQRTRPRTVPFHLSLDEVLLLRNGKVGMNGSGPSMSDDVSDGRRLRRS